MNAREQGGTCRRCGGRVPVGGKSDPDATLCPDCRSTAPWPDGFTKGRDVEPHPDGERLAEEAVRVAQRLACAIRDDGAYEVARITDPLSREQLVALAVALAAMVPLDRPVADLLAWVDGPVLPEGQRFPELRWSEEALRMAHTAWVGGDRDPWTTEGERMYQHARHERRKAERKAS